MPSPWAKISVAEPTNLQDIISEEVVVKKVQAARNKKDLKLNVITNQTENSEVSKTAVTKISDESAIDEEFDAVVIGLAQQQFVEKYDAPKNAHKEALNIPVFLKDPCRTLQNLDDESESESEEIEDFHDHKFWEQSETAKEEIAKHDDTLNDPTAMNCCSVIRTGSEAECDMQFEILKRSNQKLTEFVLDKYSTPQIRKMIKQHMFQNVNYVISREQISVILHAESDPAYSNGSLPKECALKVFKLDKPNKVFKINERRKINMLAEREWLNLCRLQKAEIPCPKAVALQKNILIMSFIGENGVCAPRLKDAGLTKDEYVLAYNQVVEAMKRLYCKANLIQVDLNEDKIFWHNQQCYFIGLKQAVELYSPEEFYVPQNYKHLVWFFRWQGVRKAKADELFTQITGKSYQKL